MSGKHGAFCDQCKIFGDGTYKCKTKHARGTQQPQPCGAIHQAGGCTDDDCGLHHGHCLPDTRSADPAQ